MNHVMAASGISPQEQSPSTTETGPPTESSFAAVAGPGRRRLILLPTLLLMTAALSSCAWMVEDALIKGAVKATGKAIAEEYRKRQEAAERARRASPGSGKEEIQTVRQIHAILLRHQELQKSGTASPEATAGERAN